jgi:hypothetical protein
MKTRGNGKSEGPLGKIIIGVVIALLAGGSSPWWWTKVFPPAIPKAPYMSELQWNTNLQGSDIANINKPEVNTAGECSDLCLKNPHCKAVTFVQHPSGSGGICWLKDAVPPRSANAAMTSAIKIFP